MKALVLAHYADRAEQERAYDLINNHQIFEYCVANTDQHVVNLDVVRRRLHACGALIVLASQYDVPGCDEWESARVEREAIEYAEKCGRLVGIIGRSKALLRPHLLLRADAFRVIGLFCESRDKTGGMNDTFPRADILHVGDMRHGVKPFLARLSAHVVRSAA